MWDSCFVYIFVIIYTFRILSAGVGRGKPGEPTLRFPSHLHTTRNAPLQRLVLPMPMLEILLQEFPRRLLLADTALEQHMLRITGSIHSVKLHRLHTLAKLQAEA